MVSPIGTRAKAWLWRFAAEHGAGSGMSVKADNAGFIVAYPAGLGSRAGWELIGTEDLDFVDALLTSLAAEMCFDPHRVYASGSRWAAV